MTILSGILIFLISCFVLSKAGSSAIKTLVFIARYLKWREFTVAFIIMAFGTSLPEFFVGVFSAVYAKPDLAFGNIIGSNIINLTLGIGLTSLIVGRLLIKKDILQKTSIYTAIVALMPILLMLDRNLSRVDGAILLFILFVYLLYFRRERKKFTKILNSHSKKNIEEFNLFLKNLGVFLISFVLLLISAEFLVWSGVSLARAFHIPLILIGILVIAFGTNLPELVFGAKALVMNRPEMIIGGFMGSVVVNSTFVLGITLLIHPLSVPKFSPYFIGIIFTILTTLLFAIFARTNREFSRKEGLYLLIVYILFVLLELMY